MKRSLCFTLSFKAKKTIKRLFLMLIVFLKDVTLRCEGLSICEQCPLTLKDLFFSVSVISISLSGLPKKDLKDLDIFKD